MKTFLPIKIAVLMLVSTSVGWAWLDDGDLDYSCDEYRFVAKKKRNINGNWQLDAINVSLKKGTLTVSGNGKMPDYGDRCDRRPYTSYGRWSSDITAVIIHEGITHIGIKAFANLDMIKSITIPNGVSSIGDEAFYGCTNLTSVVIPTSVKTIGKYAFAGCWSLKSINIPNSVTYIGDGAFYGSYLSSIIIPGKLKSIERNVFAGCGNLKTVTIPSSVTSIGDGAFMQSGLRSITIPASVTYIGEKAFFRANSMSSIIVLNPTPPKIGSDVFIRSDSVKNDRGLYVPRYSIDAYRSAEGWNDFKYIKPLTMIP